MYHPIAATCPSDMVVRVRKVLANRGLPHGCIVWPFGPRVALSTEKCKRYINILLLFYYYYYYYYYYYFLFLLFFLRVRELKGLDLRTEPLRIIFCLSPRTYWTLSVLLSFLQYILSDYRWCGLAVEEPSLFCTLTMDLIISTVCSEGQRNYYLLITKSTNTWYANSFNIAFYILHLQYIL